MSVESDSIENLRAEVTRLRGQCDALSSEKAKLEAALAARSDESSAMLSAFVEQLPIGIGIFRADGLMAYSNAEGDRMFGVPREVVVGRFNPLTDPQSVALGTQAVFAEVVKGATITKPPYKYDSTHFRPGEEHGFIVWVETVYFPLVQPDGAVSHIATMNRDVTVLVEQKAALEATRGEVLAVQREVEAQRETIAALSSPVIQVWKGILTIPLIGVIDASRAAKITQDLLDAIVRHRAECVILDVTGVALMDSEVSTYLLATTRACRLLGCEAALVGIGPASAQTIVELGVDLSGIVTRANLEAGIAWAFERRGLSVV
jgi:rsbT co-antagonist protein RsbR